MRADRLLSLLLLLQTRGRMTARELAEQLEVSERTIYRDMEALSIAGIPVYAERGPGGGCILIDGYQTRLTGLTEAEVQALFLLHSSTRPLADLGLHKALDAALLKLSAVLPAEQRQGAEQVRQRIYLDTAEWPHSEQIIPHLQTLQEALWHDRKVLLSYSQHNSLCTEHLVEPYGLVSKAQHWYLVGAVANASHVFRLSSIRRVTITAEHFTRPACFDLSAYWTEYRTHLKEKNGFNSSADNSCSSNVQPTQKKGNLLPQYQRLTQKKASSPSHHQPSQQKKHFSFTKHQQSQQKNRFHNPKLQQPQQKKAFIISATTTKKENQRSLNQQKNRLLPPLKKANSFEIYLHCA